MTLPTPAPTGTTSAGKILFHHRRKQPARLLIHHGHTPPERRRGCAALIQIYSTTKVKARALDGTTWSALMEATFSLGSPLSPVRITEINYNPKVEPGGAASEFVEVQNTRRHRSRSEHLVLRGHRVHLSGRTNVSRGQPARRIQRQGPGNLCRPVSRCRRSRLFWRQPQQ